MNKILKKEKKQGKYGTNHGSIASFSSRTQWGTPSDFGRNFFTSTKSGQNWIPKSGLRWFEDFAISGKRILFFKLFFDDECLKQMFKMRF